MIEGETLIEMMRRAGVRRDGAAEFLIRRGWATVNGIRITDPDHRMSAGDRVVLSDPPGTIPPGGTAVHSGQ